jgi:hypothetical protein
MVAPVLHVVHCIDTEGPLDESPEATVTQINQLFGLDLEPGRAALDKLRRGEIELGDKSDAVRKLVSDERLAYNRTWRDIDGMLDEALSGEFRLRRPDDFGRGWVYSWHCVDHVGLIENPRRKGYGYGMIFDYYRQRASHGDEINWHFHPLSVTRGPVDAASSYLNSWDILSQVLCRRILDHGWFPVVNRPGFHTERPDSHAFLEQWIPFDYANQRHEDTDLFQRDLQHGRFGDWRRAPVGWGGYHPHHDDHQVQGECRRWIFRCLNIGTRLRVLDERHVNQALQEARQAGSAILAFANHDYRDIRPDVVRLQDMLAAVRQGFPDVQIKYSGAEAAAREHLQLLQHEKLKLRANIEDQRLIVNVEAGTVFGPQPFLALKSRAGAYFHDNFDVIEPGRKWSYVLDEQTIQVDALDRIGVGAAGSGGGYDVQVIALR